LQNVVSDKKSSVTERSRLPTRHMIYLPSLRLDTTSQPAFVDRPDYRMRPCRIQHFLFVVGISATPSYEFVLCLGRKKFQCLRQKVERFLVGGCGNDASSFFHKNAAIRKYLEWER